LLLDGGCQAIDPGGVEPQRLAAERIVYRRLRATIGAGVSALHRQHRAIAQ